MVKKDHMTWIYFLFFALLFKMEKYIIEKYQNKHNKCLAFFNKQILFPLQWMFENQTCPVFGQVKVEGPICLKFGRPKSELYSKLDHSNIKYFFLYFNIFPKDMHYFRLVYYLRWRREKKVYWLVWKKGNILKLWLFTI